jgi:hypothetical protein
MFSKEEDSRLAKPFTLEELLKNIKGFKASKSHGPDGWTISFFLFFFDIPDIHLLEMVEESKRKGRVSCALKGTFIALIPNTNNPDSFGGVRPISLCNLVYKIISKIIAARIKSSLSVGISKDQFGFLEGRQITHAIRVAQEVLCNIKVKNIKDGPSFQGRFLKLHFRWKDGPCSSPW